MNEIRENKTHIEELDQAVQQGLMGVKKIHRHRVIKKATLSIAVAAIVLVILPNTHASVAHAMGNIPVIGNFFKVVTIRHYAVDDGHNVADVDVAKVTADQQDLKNQKAVSAVNQSVDEYTNQLMNQFKKDMKNTGQGYKGLDIKHEVITNTNAWFTLKLTILETQASGAESYRYYHINKTTGKVVTLSDLFKKNADYVQVISNNIKKQMLEQMKNDTDKMYFYGSNDELADNFDHIKKDQNFYFNKKGELVIAFDEYEVAPGSMGSPVFVIPQSVISSIIQ